jgi:hypothetical protein
MPMDPRRRALALGIATVVGLVGYLILGFGAYQPDAYSYIPRVAEVPAMAITGAPVHEDAARDLDAGGRRAKDGIFGNLKGFSGYSVESEMGLTVDQRLGLPVLLSAPVAFLKGFGFRFFYGMERLLLGLAIFLVIRRCGGGRWGGLVGALSLVLSSFVLNIRALNPNVTSILLASGVFLLLLDDAPTRAKVILAGVLTGALAVVAHLSLCLVFVAPLLVLRRFGGGGPRLRRGWLYFPLGVLAVLGPWAVLAFLNDVPLGREVAFAVFPDDPEVEAEVLGQIGARLEVAPAVVARYIYDLGPGKLFFYGLLNFPLNDRLIRCGDYPFPFSLLSVLIVVRAFGVLLSGLALYGFAATLRDPARRWRALALGAWFIGFLGFFGLFENLDPYKTTFILWMFPPVAILAGVGLGRLVGATGLRRTVPAVALAVAVALLLPVGARAIHVPEDPRWEPHFRMKRFPLAFVEVAPEKAGKLRRSLTAGNLLPGPCDDLFFGGPVGARSGPGGWAREAGSFQAELPEDTVNAAFLDMARSAGPGAVVVYNSISFFTPGTALRTAPVLLRGPLPSPFMMGMLDELAARLRAAPELRDRLYFLDQLFFSHAQAYRERFDLDLVRFDGHFALYRLGLGEEVTP